MPQCCLLHDCRRPHWPENLSLKCVGCSGWLHLLCYKNDAGLKGLPLLETLSCLACHDKKYGTKLATPAPPAQLAPPAPTDDEDDDDDEDYQKDVQGTKQAPDTTVKESPAAPKETAGALNRKAPASKRKAVSKPKKKQAKKVKITAPPTKKSDPYLKQGVAFRLDGDEEETVFKAFTQDLLPYGRKLDCGGIYLLGTVIAKEKSSKYTIEFQNTNIKQMALDLPRVHEANLLHREIDRASVAMNNKKPALNVKARVIDAMTKVEDKLELGDHIIDSDSEDEELDDDKGSEYLPDLHNYQKQPRVPLTEELHFPSLDLQEVGTSYQTEGMTWEMYQESPQPHQTSHARKTHLKPGTASNFATPLSSFLAFLPLEFWKLYVFRTNSYAAWKKRAKEAEGRTFAWTDLTLDEFMTFFAILIKMTLRPTPGQRYTDCWDDVQWHPYTAWMTRQRFTSIRGVLHMSEKGEMEAVANDSLYKVRPILNTLHHTIGKYLEPGANLALDESSVAARSSYGRKLIFYNNTKPCGKYHFRFYFVNESDSFALMRFKVHTKDDSDSADVADIAAAIPKVAALPAPTTIHDDKQDELTVVPRNTAAAVVNEEGTLDTLVLHMFEPWFQSGRTANMDNYYTSPNVFSIMRMNGLFARGTCRANRSMFPQAVLYSKTEASKVKRGALRFATALNTGLVAMGWVDGNPVQLLTTADGTVRSEVTRRVKNEKQKVPAPQAIRRYNKNMQAVDRFDQLVALFSMANRHAFKKYYNKLTMALIDIALVNAEIHYHLANPSKKKENRHRYKFRDELADSLNQQSWSQMFSADPFDQGTDISDDISVQDTYSGIDGSMVQVRDSETTTYRCSFTSVGDILKKYKGAKGMSRDGLCCQVCAFENRKVKTKHVVLCDHGIRSCSGTHNDYRGDCTSKDIASNVAQSPTKASSWLAPSQLSCFEKLHQFYIPKGLFGKHPVVQYDNITGAPKSQYVRRSSSLYKEKVKWLTEKGLPAPKLTRQRKSASTQQRSEPTSSFLESKGAQVTNEGTTRRKLNLGNLDTKSIKNQYGEEDSDSDSE